MASQHSTALRAANRAMSGWVVKTPQGYYTGTLHSARESWTVHRKFAKVYKRHGWAQKMAARLGGHAMPITLPARGRSGANAT